MMTDPSPMPSIVDTIRIRRSIRTYADTPIEEETKMRLMEFIGNSGTGPLGRAIRFSLVDVSDVDGREMKRLSTYGVIRGASQFIVGTAEPQRQAFVDFGYCMEKIILFATAMGLGTCWVGGTFNRSRLAGRLNLPDDRLIPAISPVGYAADKRSVIDKLIVRAAGSAKRKRWESLFFTGDFKHSIDELTAGSYRIALESVRLAPSASNRQPWRIVKENDVPVFHFCLRRNKNYDRRFKTVSLQEIDMGIAMCHFELTALEIGLDGTWQDCKKDFYRENREYFLSWVGKGTSSHG